MYYIVNYLKFYDLYKTLKLHYPTLKYLNDTFTLLDQYMLYWQYILWERTVSV